MMIHIRKVLISLGGAPTLEKSSLVSNLTAYFYTSLGMLDLESWSTIDVGPYVRDESEPCR